LSNVTLNGPSAPIHKGEQPMKRKISIACQGGGSQTAFTAGVLRSFFENDLHHKSQIVSLTGTSGGAICASLAWYGLLRAAQGDRTPIQNRLMDFWQDLSAHLAPELSLEKFMADWLRSVDKGWLPSFESSPASAMSQLSLSMLTSIMPRREFTDLKAMVERHIKFGELPHLIEPDSPVLLLGAADVLTGEMKVFNSREGEIQVEAILASAAVPSLFPAVQIGSHYYWDGLFSDNPPVKEVVRWACVGGERIPDEIWIIQINPKECKTVPTTPAAIVDRRNEMIGNVSMLQSLEFIKLINRLLEAKAISEDVLKKLEITKRDPIEIHFIHMSEELQDTLDYVSKLTRTRSHIERLIKDGEKQGLAFLETHAAQRETCERD
jgi:NTE family protein